MDNDFLLDVKRDNTSAVEAYILDGGDPSISDNMAIYIASAYGYDYTVDILLKDSRTHSGGLGDRALYIATTYEQYEIVKKLLDAGLNPAACDNLAVINAAEQGNLMILEMLLEDKRTDPSDKNNDAIGRASENGHSNIVDRLLKDPRVNPGASNDYAFRAAAENGHIDIIGRLMLDPRVNLAVCNNYVIGETSQLEVFEWIEVTNKLLSYPIVYKSINPDKVCFSRIRQICTRAAEVCVGLQDLGLPALQTVHILDELIPNCVSMWALWQLTTTVKHFHDRKK
jgi:hypothetical protein